ncbi:MAG: hypothetical protein PUD50_03220 [Eubacteriales bacterium]|nr:hypothetical protein [Eubacteriales bacterium]
MDRHIELGGQEISLRYTVNAMCAVEDRAGGALERLTDRQFTATRLLLWGGMLSERPDTTLQEAGEIISRHMEQGGSLDEIVDVCAMAMRDAGFFHRAAEA